MILSFTNILIQFVFSSNIPVSSALHNRKTDLFWEKCWIVNTFVNVELYNCCCTLCWRAKNRNKCRTQQLHIRVMFIVHLVFNIRFSDTKDYMYWHKLNICHLNVNLTEWSDCAKNGTNSSRVAFLKEVQRGKNWLLFYDSTDIWFQLDQAKAYYRFPLLPSIPWFSLFMNIIKCLSLLSRVSMTCHILWSLNDCCTIWSVMLVTIFLPCYFPCTTNYPAPHHHPNHPCYIMQT